MSATLRTYTEAYTTGSTNVLTANHTAVSGDKLLVFVSGMKAAVGSLHSWDFTSVTFDGDSGSLIEETEWESTNRGFRLKAYVFSSPSIGTNEFRIETNESIRRMGFFVCSYTDVNSFGATAASPDTSDMEYTISPNLSGSFSLVAIGGACRAGSSGITPDWYVDAPAEMTDSWVTGLGTEQLDLSMGLAHAYPVTTGSVDYTMGVTTGSNEIGMLAVEIMSTIGFSAEMEVYTQAAPIVTNASMEISVNTPTVLVGSIPPTQVLWQGNLFFSTKTRTVNVLFLTTSGSNWVLPDNLGDAQTVGVTLTRRRAYLIPH